MLTTTTPRTTSSKVIGATSIDSGSASGPTTRRRFSVRVSATRTAVLCAATQPVRPVPMGTRRSSAEGSETPMKVPPKAIGSHIPAALSTR